MVVNICAVDVTHCAVYDFIQKGETPNELLKRANESRESNIASWAKHCVDYPCNEQFKGFLRSEEAKQYKVMTWDEYEAYKRDFMLKDDMREITAEEWDNALNVLPPLQWCIIHDVEMFCNSEMLTDTYTSQYARYNGKYYIKIVDVLDKSTWIYKYLVKGNYNED